MIEEQLRKEIGRMKKETYSILISDEHNQLWKLIRARNKDGVNFGFMIKLINETHACKKEINNGK